MPVVSSFGALTTPPTQASAAALGFSRSTGLQSASAATYAAIYRTQPNVRTVIDFLARNIAQLGLHVFRRVTDLDRERLADHDLVQWIEHPNPGTTRYRLIESLMQDLGIYLNAYWIKVRDPQGGSRIGLARVPPEQMTVEGWLMPSAFVWTQPDGTEKRYAPSEVVYFGGYDPCDPVMGLSPLETLRQVLSEEQASADFRENYWRNSARIEGVIERPLAAPKWTTDQMQAFREMWQGRFAGMENGGRTAILNEGMTFKPVAFSARDSEFVAARKLSRDEVARAYHVPLPMVGILEHATFSNIKEQHKQLYQDCLGPWLVYLQEEIERQLLPESADAKGVYCEFNIAEKLKGSFEEQADSLYKLIGRPIMTANEGRARINLPSITDDETADQLALPLNTSTGSAQAPPVPEATTAATELRLLPAAREAA